MKRLWLLLTALMVATPILAQSTNSATITGGRYAFITLTKYCDAVENLSKAHQPRVFAQIPAGLKSSSPWIEFSSEGAWRVAGEPKPLALVWYKDETVARIIVKSSDSPSDGRWYADYCYRPDGSLARLRSVPETQSHCDQSLLTCNFISRGERLYPPKAIEHVKPSTKPVERRPSETEFDFADGNDPVLRPLQSERTSVFFAPMDWPEYLTVGDLPFNPLP